MTTRSVEDFRAWLRAHADELGAHRHHAAGPIESQMAEDRRFQRILWDAGWLRWGWPEDCGGVGGSVLDRGAVYEALWSEGFVAPEGLATVETIAPCVITFARPLAQHLLTPYLRGDESWCQGFSEPDAGSDLASLRTKIVDTGGVLRVTGQKIWSSQGSFATRCLLLARSGPEQTGPRGLTMLLVDLDGPGVETRPIAAANGRNEFAEIFFDDAPVSPSRVLGSLGEGWAIAMSLLQWERGMYAWQRQAFLHARLQTALEHGPTDPVRLAQAFVALAALRLKCKRTLRALAAGLEPGPDISEDKLLLSGAEHAVMDYVREQGGSSFAIGDSSYDALMRQDWFYSRTTSIYGGAAEVQLNIVGERLLGLPKEPRGGRV